MGNTELSALTAYRLKCLCDIALGVRGNRPKLEVVHVEAEKEHMFLVATDGFRLVAVCLPVGVEEPVTLNISPMLFKKLLGPKVQLSVTPLGLDVSGLNLSDYNSGYDFPDWRQIIPRAVEPRANIAAFAQVYASDFLKFRIGPRYNKRPTGADDIALSSAIMRWSVYSSDSCGLDGTSHCWAWRGGWPDNVVEYLYILMPLHVMHSTLFGLAGDVAKEAFYERHAKLEELLDGQLESLVQERLATQITDVTGPIPELWRKK